VDSSKFATMTTTQTTPEKPVVESEEHAPPGNTNNWAGTNDDAKFAAEAEKNLGFMQAIKLHRKAAGWTFAISLGIVMGAYDQSLIGGLYGQPSFRMHYGDFYPGIGYQIASKWQVALSLAVNIGNIIGVGLNGYVVDRYGYRRVLVTAYFFIIAFIFIQFFAKSKGVLFAGELLSGIPLGMFDVLGNSFVSEVCPTALRG